MSIPRNLEGNLEENVELQEVGLVEDPGGRPERRGAVDKRCGGSCRGGEGMEIHSGGGGSGEAL
jgi:hypothetical protein